MGLFDRRRDAKDARDAGPAQPPSPPELGPEEAVIPEEPATAEEPVPAAEEPVPMAAEHAPATPPAQVAPAIHTVAAGESLSDLAGRYGVPAEEIARQNHLPSPGAIHPGQVFVIRS